MLLVARCERRELGVVAPGQPLASPARLESRGDVRHVHEALGVVAGGARGTRVAFSVRGVAVAEPVSDPPCDATAERAEATTVLEPVAQFETSLQDPCRARQLRLAGAFAKATARCLLHDDVHATIVLRSAWHCVDLFNTLCAN